MHVTDDRMVDPGFDTHHQVVAIDVADHFVRLSGRGLLRRTPCHDLVGDVFDLAGAHRGRVRRRPTQEAPRRDPDLIVLRPGEILRRNPLIERTGRWRWTATWCGRLSDAGGTRRGLREIDRARVAADRRRRQAEGDRSALAEVALPRRSRVRDRSHAGRPHRRERVRNDRPRILRPCDRR
jgi:hypothetical protein